MKTIKYIDENGLKEIFRIFNNTIKSIVMNLSDLDARLEAMSSAVNTLDKNTTEMSNSINKIKDELSALNFDMGSYPESE